MKFRYKYLVEIPYKYGCVVWIFYSSLQQKKIDKNTPYGIKTNNHHSS